MDMCFLRKEHVPSALTCTTVLVVRTETPVQRAVARVALAVR